MAGLAGPESAAHALQGCVGAHSFGLVEQHDAVDVALSGAGGRSLAAVHSGSGSRLDVTLAVAVDGIVDQRGKRAPRSTESSTWNTSSGATRSRIWLRTWWRRKPAACAQRLERRLRRHPRPRTA